MLWPMPAGRHVHTKETRSYNMSRIKSKNTKPEMLLRKFLHANGYRYRLHERAYPVNLVLFYQSIIVIFVYSLFKQLIKKILHQYKCSKLL